MIDDSGGGLPEIRAASALSFVYVDCLDWDNTKMTPWFEKKKKMGGGVESKELTNYDVRYTFKIAFTTESFCVFENVLMNAISSLYTQENAIDNYL